MVAVETPRLGKPVTHGHGGRNNYRCECPTCVEVTREYQAAAYQRKKHNARVIADMIARRRSNEQGRLF